MINRIVFRQSHYRDHTNGIWGHTSYVKIPFPSTNSLSSSIHQFLGGAGLFCSIHSPSPSSLKSLEDIEKEILEKNEVILNERTSICIERSSIADGNSHGITIYQDNGFSANDVENIANAIGEVFKHHKAPSSSASSSSSSALPRRSNSESPSTGMEQTGRYRDKDGTTIQGEDKDEKRILDQIRSLGVNVYEDYKGENPLTWDSLAGFESIKREIKDTLVNALAHPEIYDEIARQTRVNYETDACRPRAILFEGPPGTGKTLSARIIANQVEKPLVLVSVENILSKWYGESERNLSKVFDACDALPDGAMYVI